MRNPISIPKQSGLSGVVGRMLGGPVVMNPITGDPVKDPKLAADIVKLRQVRTKARPDARSGNPAKRASGRRAIAIAPEMIRRIYLRDAGIQ